MIDLFPSRYEHFHNGPNQAGNKSLISFNSKTGVPGCTVFIPATASLLLPTRVGEHTGRPVDTKSREEAALSTVEGKVPKASE